jgi:signal transduction histidine kinase
MAEIESYPQSVKRMQPKMDLDDLKRYIGFCETDEAVLSAFWPCVEPELEPLCRDFYARAMAHPTTARVLHDPAQVERLMGTLKVWLKEMINGPWDDKYAVRRRKIGEVHVRVGLSHDAMFVAMGAMRDGLIRIAFQCALDSERAVRAIARISEIDLSLMTATYNEIRNQIAIRDFQLLLVEHIPSIVILADRQLQVVAATPAAEYRFGFTTQPLTRVEDVIPPNLWNAAGLETRLRRCLESGHAITLPRVDFELDRQPKHFAATLVPIDQRSGFVLLYFDDHTAAVENEALLQRQESLAQLGALSATIAHELRNPLAGISGALQVIASSLESDHRYHSIIGKVIDEIKSLNRLVTDLLAFARPREALLRHEVDLGEIVERVIEFARAEHPRIAFSIRGASTATADPDMVSQIIKNLVINACDALSERASARVELTLADDHIEVCDNGPGVPEEIQDRLFQPFYTTKLKGTGLGLAVSQRMALLMNMALVLDEAHQSGGACFRLQFDAPAA